MVYWQKRLTRRVPLHKAHFTCALRNIFLSETLVWPDFSAKRNKNSARSRSWKWPLPFLCLLFFFFFFSISLSCEMCSCPSPRGGRRSGERGRTQSRVRVVGEGFRVSLEMLKQGQVTGADYRTVPPPPRRPCDRKKLTVTFRNVIPPKHHRCGIMGPRRHRNTASRTRGKHDPRSSQEYVNEPRAGNDQAKKLDPDIDQ